MIFGSNNHSEQPGNQFGWKIDFHLNAKVVSAAVRSKAVFLMFVDSSFIVALIVWWGLV